jgi:hypothetical protein
MQQIVIRGEPALLADFDHDLTEAFAEAGLADKVKVNSELEQLAPAPGQMGFGEEIRKVLIGVSDVLKASKDALEIVAHGIAERLSQRKLRVIATPDGVDVRASGDLQDVAAVTAQIVELLKAQQSAIE